MTIKGRTSTDIIKSGGYKIGAGEVEDLLLEHPAVAEVAVRGLPDDDLGEIVAAWVVLERPDEPHPNEPAQPGGSEDQALWDADVAADLCAWAGGALSRHKRPRTVFIVDELPRNAMGKVQKRLLDATPAPGAAPARQTTSERT